MIYRLKNGNLIEINRKYYIDDSNYYEEIYKYINSISKEIDNHFINNNLQVNKDNFNEIMGNTNDNIMNYIKEKK